MGWFTLQSKPVCHFCQSRLLLISPDLKGKAKVPDSAFGWDNSPNAFLCGVCDSWNTKDDVSSTKQLVPSPAGNRPWLS